MKQKDSWWNCGGWWVGRSEEQILKYLNWDRIVGPLVQFSPSLTPSFLPLVRAGSQGVTRVFQENSDLLRAMASSRSSCSCCACLAKRTFSSRSLSLVAHSIMSSSVGYCCFTPHRNTQKHTHRHSTAPSEHLRDPENTYYYPPKDIH